MEQTKTRKLYGLAKALGINDAGLHALTEGVTGEQHISRLTDGQYNQVLAELYVRLKISEMEPPPATATDANYKDGSASRGMTKGQRQKVWHLMYQLRATDQHTRSATLGERLRGIIKRELHVDATAEQPFLWLDYRQGGQLIEAIKHYVASAAKRSDTG